MKIWIDIVNSPHVLFFKPIIEELKQKGHSIDVTAREYAQTTGLLHEFQLPYTLIGAHAGAQLSKKIFDVFKRGVKLCTYARNKKFDLALTFNSPSMALAAKILRIPSMVFMDYEHQPLNHLTFRLCDKVVTPEIFPNESLKKLGAIKKTLKYDGLKEQVYLSDFNPSPDFLDGIGLDKNKIIITARPPATMALYHRFENDLFYEVIKHLLNNKDVLIIAIPRSEEQRTTLTALSKSNLIVLDKPVDGRNLLYYSDMVVSAGGTMNREAAVLGTPAYTVFKGKIGAVDKYLMDLGRIISIETFDDLKKIKTGKINQKNLLINAKLKSELMNLIFTESLH
jgi:predicted glycosyltransferase